MSVDAHQLENALKLGSFEKSRQLELWETLPRNIKEQILDGKFSDTTKASLDRLIHKRKYPSSYETRFTNRWTNDLLLLHDPLYYDLITESAIYARVDIWTYQNQVNEQRRVVDKRKMMTYATTSA